MNPGQPGRASALAALQSACEKHFEGHGNFTQVFAPGRVNLLGDHTDYNQGFVLPMTLGHGVYQAIRPDTGGRVRVHALNFEQTLEFDLAKISAFPTPQQGSWACYVVGVLREFAAQVELECGFDLLIYGDLPAGAGLSSSAALTVSTALALQQLTGFVMPPTEMAQLCQRVEHRYAGVNCGIMDQFVCTLGMAGHTLFLDCRSLEYRHIPTQLDGHCIVVIHSGVNRSLATSQYNERRAECDAGVEVLQRRYDGVCSLRDVTQGMLQDCIHDLQATTAQRCQHVVAENERVLSAVKAQQNTDLGEFGVLMSASHRSLRDLYEVSCPQLDMLVELCQATDGVLGSRMTGAGFGGCVVALVKSAAVAALGERVQTDYRRRSGCEPRVFPITENFAAGVLA